MVIFACICTYFYIGVAIKTLIDISYEPDHITNQHLTIFGKTIFIELCVVVIIGLLVNIAFASFCTILGIYHIRLKNMGLTTYEHIMA